MTAETTPAQGPVDEADGLLPALSMPHVVLAGLTAPLPLLWGMTIPVGVMLALLGHPVIGLVATLGNMSADWLAQTFYRRWRLTADDDREDVVMGRVSLAVSLRSMVAMYGVVAVVLSRGDPADLMFAGVMSAMLLCVAVAQGSLSARLFWMTAWPVLGGLAIAVTARFSPVPAAVLLGAITMLGAMLLLLTGGVARIFGEWTAIRERNTRLIERLVAERTEAERAREEARLAGEAKANFLATMSHEIRTPMNGVLGMAQLLRRSASDGEQRQQIETLIHSGEYLMSILNDILDISRIDAGLLETAAVPEDLTAMLEELGRFWQPSAQEKGLYLEVDIAPDLPTWFAMDARRVRQMLFNLIGNALKFTSVGGVTLAVDHAPLADGRVQLRIAVRDTGIGIDPRALPALFERFSQADQSISRQFGGAGLGLAISRQLAELMGGRLWAESRPGEGSCFQLELPLTPFAAAGAGPEDAATAGAQSAPQNLRILVVDDNAVNLMVLDQVLAALGHQAVRANSGAEALALAAGQAFDLVLMDIRMPGMSGIEALQTLRASDGPNRATPVLAVTADVLTHAHGGYLSLGFAGHVSKPIQVANLVAEIDTVMSSHAAASVAA